MTRMRQVDGTVDDSVGGFSLPGWSRSMLHALDVRCSCAVAQWELAWLIIRIGSLGLAVSAPHPRLAWVYLSAYVSRRTPIGSVRILQPSRPLHTQLEM